MHAWPLHQFTDELTLCSFDTNTISIHGVFIARDGLRLYAYASQHSFVGLDHAAFCTHIHRMCALQRLHA